MKSRLSRVERPKPKRRNLVVAIVQGLVGLALLSLVQLALFLPTAGIIARRLQDTGKNGSLVWILMIPVLISSTVTLLASLAFGGFALLLIFLPLFVVMGVFLFFASRRQKKAMQATIDLHESLQIGDRVHTTSGLEATIMGITDDTVDLEIAPGVVTTWMKLAIRDRIVDEVDDLDDDEDDEFNPELTDSEAIEEPRRLTSD